MPSSFLRQLSVGETCRVSSKRWCNRNTTDNRYYHHQRSGGGEESDWWSNCGEMESVNWYENGGFVMRKRVMVVVDQTSHSKHAMMWALTHVVNKGDLITLLHVIPPGYVASSESAHLAPSLGSLCKASKPEVEVEALVIQGPKLATIMSQVKKLEVSVLVLGQRRASSLLNCFCVRSSSEELVEECIDNVECLTIGVRKQSRGMGGYLISTKWQKNFWLLA